MDNRFHGACVCTCMGRLQDAERCRRGPTLSTERRSMLKHVAFSLHTDSWTDSGGGEGDEERRGEHVQIYKEEL